MKRSKQPLVTLTVVISLSLLLVACQDEEGKQYFNRLVFQDVKQCSTYLSPSECNKFFDKIKFDLDNKNLNKYKIYETFESCILKHKICEQYEQKFYAVPNYYVAFLDKDYNEQNNFIDDIKIIDYDFLYEKNNIITEKNEQPINTNGTNPIGFYYFGFLNNGIYGSTNNATNSYYKQPITTKTGSYMSNYGKPYSGISNATMSKSSISRGGFSMSSPSSS